MNAVGDRELGIGCRGSGVGFLFAAIAFAALPIFAHGCHRGDHDDEPLVTPVEQRAKPIEKPQ